MLRELFEFVRIEKDHLETFCLITFQLFFLRGKDTVALHYYNGRIGLYSSAPS